MAEKKIATTDEKLIKLAMTIAKLAVAISLVLLVLFTAYLFWPSSTPSTAGAVKPALRYDSTWMYTTNDTTFADTSKKIFKNSIIVTVKTDSTNKSTPTTSTAGCTFCIKDKMDTIYKYYILLFAVLISAVILPRLKSITANATGITLDTYEKKQTNDTTEKNTTPPTKEEAGVEEKPLGPIRNLVADGGQPQNQPGILSYSSDPQKGNWGRMSVANNRKLTAVVKESSWSKEIFEVTLLVESLDPVSHPLTGIVVFHLHPTFSNANPQIFVINGIAELNVKAWGAFTLGAETDGGITKLEQDLAELPDAPQIFRSR